MKNLTDRLLESGRREPEFIENGRLLMEQMADEWIGELEDSFDCRIDLTECKDFSGKVDVEELRRIFDNLSSNVKKYASPQKPVYMHISVKDKEVCICQFNERRRDASGVESNKRRSKKKNGRSNRRSGEIRVDRTAATVAPKSADQRRSVPRSQLPRRSSEIPQASTRSLTVILSIFLRSSSCRYVSVIMFFIAVGISSPPV